MTKKFVPKSTLKRELKQYTRSNQGVSNILIQGLDDILKNIVKDIGKKLNKEPYNFLTIEHLYRVTNHWRDIKLNETEKRKMVADLETMRLALDVLIEKHRIDE